MNNAIHRDLERTERCESHLWTLSLALLILFGTVIIGHYSAILLDGAGFGSELSRATMYRAVGGLIVLVVLFCLYVMRTLVLNRRMRSLLVEVGGVAASSMEVDDFLPSLAHKIARASSVTSCQIALSANGRTALTIRSAYADEGSHWRPQIGRTYPLKELSVRGEVVDALRPVVLDQQDMARFPLAEQELFTGGLMNVQSVLVVPMVAKDRLLGLIILGAVGGFMKKRFSTSRIATALALARYTADAIDQSKLKKQALRDPLTNLYNRRHFTERIKEEMARAHRDEHIVVILLCDLDNFKRINDSRGHQVGDAVLKATANSIQASTRGTDLVFRWGGDEFVVVLSGSSREGALIVASRIRQGVLNAAETGQLDLDVSIGIALYPEHGHNEEELIRVADRALYIAKQDGEKVQVGEEEYRLDERSIKAVYQPVVDIRSRQVVGYEALTRDPQGKLGVPALFEKYRAIGRLNELKKLAFASQIRKAQEIRLEKVFINADFDVLTRLEPIPTYPGMDVVIELSEHEALHDLDSHLRVARRWREEGYKFAIDDFGAGFISLPFLSMLVPEYIKIDRSTMLQSASSEQFRDFLKRLLQLVGTYSTVGIIAEGIETEEELQMAREMGISLAQGFMLGRPQELRSEPGVVTHSTACSRAIADLPR